jgi:hypothetical protein
MLIAYEATMSQDGAQIPLPKAWPKHVRSAVARVIALGRRAIVAARGKAANSPLEPLLLAPVVDLSMLASVPPEE